MLIMQMFFLFNLAIELFKNININKYIIKLVESKQSLYGSIYALSPVKLEILKTYIETHLKTEFIQPSKSPTGAPILFDKKPDNSLYLSIDYQSLNNIAIKNWYPLPLIEKSLDWLERAK